MSSTLTLRMKKIGLSIATMLAAVVVHGCFLSESDDPSIIALEDSLDPMHLWVQWEEHPSEEAVVSWTTVSEGSSNTVHYDTTARDGNVDAYAFQAESINSGPFSLREEEQRMAAHYHHALLNDLEPSTTYYLVAATDGNQTEEYHFTTAPADDRPFKVLVGGDSRVGTDNRVRPDNNRRGMNKRMAALLEEHPDIIALVHTADYTNRAYWHQLYWWLKDHFETTTTSEGRLLPILPTRGNHDLDVGFEEKFWWPGRSQDYYYVSHLNEDNALIALNTEISRGGDQREWLEEQLQTLRPEKRWLWAAYHRPSFPSVRNWSSGEGMRRAWVPLFEEYGLDLSAAGHDHALKRTPPIRSEEIVDADEGIVYIGDGGLGVSQRDPDPSRWYLQDPGMTQSVHHVHMMSFNSDSLRVQVFSMNGDVLDDFALQPRLQQRPETVSYGPLSD